MPSSPRRRALLGVALALAGPALLVAHTLAFCRGLDLRGLDSWRRLWGDLALATAAWADAERGPAREVVASGPAAVEHVRRQVLDRVRWQRLRAVRPWEVATPRPFLRERVAPERRPYDDPGRAVLLSLAFRVRGGVLPFLVFWLGLAAATPAVAWATWELWAAGRTRAATAMAALLGLSPFVIETLALGRYPVGFYLAGALLVVPLAVYGRLHPRPTAGGLGLRLLVAAAGLALCTFCRSSAAVLLPGFALAAGMGALRVTPSLPRRLAFATGAVALVALPLALVPGAQQNDVWQPVWEGLGDFDRSHGFAWSDAVAEEVVVREGAPGLFTPESEAILGRQVRSAVRDDPAWFAGVLGRRLLSTVSLWKLWPWRPLDGTFLRRQVSPNEGVVDKYWTYTTTVDHLGVAGARVELPVPALLAPPLLLLALASRGPRARAAREALAVLACPAAATLVLPVLVTTAGGQETQAFALVHLLAGALALDLPTSPERR